MTPEEEDYLVEQFTVQKFQYSKFVSLHFEVLADAKVLQICNSTRRKYASTLLKKLNGISHTTQGRYLSWKFAHDQGNQTLPQPILTVYPSKASCILSDERIRETDIPQDAVADWPTFAGYMGTKKYIPHWTTEVCQFS